VPNVCGAKRLRAPEEENRDVKTTADDLSFDKEGLKAVIRTRLELVSARRDGSGKTVV